MLVVLFVLVGIVSCGLLLLFVCWLEVVFLDGVLCIVVISLMSV